MVDPGFQEPGKWLSLQEWRSLEPESPLPLASQVAFRVIPSKSPGMLYDVVESSVLRLPTEKGPGPRPSAHENRLISFPFLYDLGRHGSTRHPFHRLHDLQDGDPESSSEVAENLALSTLQDRQSSCVRICQIENMDIVSYTGSIRRLVVVAEEQDLLSSTQCHVDHEGNEMSFGVMILSEGSVRMGPRGVEITQGGYP